MACKKCGSEKMKLRQDKRGLPEFICADCESYIKKAGASEVYEFFVSFDMADEVREEPKAEPAPKRPPCRYCTEHYGVLQGRFSHLFRPIENPYCPMCGRELEESDRRY